MGWLHDYQVAVLDTETTGLSWNRDGIAEIAIILVDGGVIAGEHVWLMNPGVPFTAEATAAHGLTDQDVAGAPSFADVAPDLDRVLGDRIPAAYNVPFDRSFLHGHVKRAGIYLPARAFQYGVDWIDVLVWARRLLDGLPNRKLATVADHLNVPTINQHRALADAKRAAEILIRLADRMPVDYAEMIAAQRSANDQHVATFARRNR